MRLSKRTCIADTNVLSYVFKDDPLAIEYARRLAGYEVHISFVTVLELQHGAEKNRWGAQRRLQLQRFLEKYPVIQLDKGILDVCARLRAERERAGRRMEWGDALIAATALWYDVELATHDAGFLNVPGLRVITAATDLVVKEPPPQYGSLALHNRVRCSF